MPGKYVSVEDTVRSFTEILNGDHDGLPEGAFLYCGPIEDAIEKAKTMETE